MDCKAAEELLPSYALNVLSEQEAALVEAHLTTCHWCSSLLREHLQVAAALAQGAERSQLPQGLKGRTMRAVEAQRRKSRSKSGPVILGRAPARWLVGAAASLAIVLLATSIGISIQMSHQVDDLQDKNAGLASQLAQGDERLANLLLELRSMSYIVASPDKQVLPLQGVREDPEAEGVLMIGDQGDVAVLMARGLEPSSGDDGYQVSLKKDGQPVVVDSLQVDENGWGILMLWADQPITSFQTVEVTKDMEEGINTSTRRRPVLWSTLRP